MLARAERRECQAVTGLVATRGSKKFGKKAADTQRDKRRRVADPAFDRAGAEVSLSATVLFHLAMRSIANGVVVPW